jgi:hypothetical protein
MTVVCLAATSCAAAADRQTESNRGAAAGEALAVRVGGDARALALVASQRPVVRPARPAKPAQPPAVTFRRTVDDQAPLRVALIGDSVAWSLLPSLKSAAIELQRLRNIPVATAGGFAGPGFGLTADVQGHNDIGPTAPPEAYTHWRDSVTRTVLVDDPDVVLVMLGIWDTIERDPGGRALRPGMPEWRQWYEMLATDFVKTLTRRGAAVVWLVMPCVGRPEINARLKVVNGALHDTWRVAPGHVGFVDVSRVACRDGLPVYKAPGPWGPIPVRMADGIHFSPGEAAAVLSPFLVRRFTALLHGVVATPRSNKR